MDAHEWDARYRTSPVSPFGDAPSHWLRTMLGRCDPGPRTALMIADGDGRNGTWLARQGLAVTALDLSPQATRLACTRDAQAGVEVDRFTADIMDWGPGAARWDLAGVFFLHGPAELRGVAVAKAIAALAPGGLLLAEGFARRRGRQRKPGPDDPTRRYTLSELRRWTGGLEIVEALTGEARLDDGPRHQGPADIVRLAARNGGMAAYAPDLRPVISSSSPGRRSGRTTAGRRGHRRRSPAAPPPTTASR